MHADIPRFMITGPGSGSGKTTLSCGILAALKRQGGNPAAFKCGPDYIDPMFHTNVLGIDSCNLDIVMCGEEVVRSLLARYGQGHGVSLVEGVMGLYDGQGDGAYGSSNHVAILTETPEVLVLSTRGQSLTLAAQISGYLNFAPNTIKGVIFNQTAERMYPFYRDMVEERLGLKAYGYLPPLPEAAFDSRHLGLVTPEETANVRAKLDILADACAASIDLEGLLELASAAPALEYKDAKAETQTSGNLLGVTIAVARDRAFCFYYHDNFEALRELGANLVFFSPLTDARLPEGASGLILGGGYPEEYAAELARNESMLASVCAAVNGGMPVFAECGGFMYLCRSIRDRRGVTHDMAGLVDSRAYMTERLGRFGYVTLTAERDTFLCPRGTVYTGHEFHYSDSDANGETFTARKAGGRNWRCVHASGPEDATRIFAGYPHVHFRGNMGLAAAFVSSCHDYGTRR